MKAFVDTSALYAVLDRSDANHNRAAFLTASRRKLSLVDCVSFVIMRDLGVKDVFGFDEDFQKEGFTCLEP
jgi:predicted nucleic acid-binding protein